LYNYYLLLYHQIFPAKTVKLLHEKDPTMIFLKDSQLLGFSMILLKESILHIHKKFLIYPRLLFLVLTTAWYKFFLQVSDHSDEQQQSRLDKRIVHKLYLLASHHR